jgi:hypothetical protein
MRDYPERAHKLLTQCVRTYIEELELALRHAIHCADPLECLICEGWRRRYVRFEEKITAKTKTQ